MQEEKLWCSLELQFGLKQGVSTTQCTHVVNETIDYHNCNNLSLGSPFTA